MKLAGVPHYTILDVSAAALARVAAAFEAAQIPYSLAYGTALGAARHGGFVPHDLDIDLFVPNCYGGAVRRVASMVRGTRLYTDPPWDDNTYVQKLMFAGAYNIDVFTEQEIEDPRHREALANFFHAERPELDRIVFCGRPYSIVPNYLEHLDLEYGPDWRDTVRIPGTDWWQPLDVYLAQRTGFRQPDTRGLKPGHCVVLSAFDGPAMQSITLLAQAWLLFGRVTAAVEADDVVRARGDEPRGDDRDRLRMINSLRWVDDTILIASADHSPASYAPHGSSRAGAERFFQTFDADVVLCDVDASDRVELDRVANRFSYARDTGRLRTIDRSS